MPKLKYFYNTNYRFLLYFYIIKYVYNNYKQLARTRGGGIITPVDSTKVIRGVGLKSIGSIPTSELLNLTDNSANTVLSIIGNTATGSCDLAVNKHKAVTISVTGATNGLSVDSNQVLSLSSATTTANGTMSSADKINLNNISTNNWIVGSIVLGTTTWTNSTIYNIGSITIPSGSGIYMLIARLYFTSTLTSGLLDCAWSTTSNNVISTANFVRTNIGPTAGDQLIQVFGFYNANPSTSLTLYINGLIQNGVGSVFNLNPGGCGGLTAVRISW